MQARDLSVNENTCSDSPMCPLLYNIILGFVKKSHGNLNGQGCLLALIYAHNVGLQIFQQFFTWVALVMNESLTHLTHFEHGPMLCFQHWNPLLESSAPAKLAVQVAPKVHPDARPFEWVRDLHPSPESFDCYRRSSDRYNTL